MHVAILFVVLTAILAALLRWLTGFGFTLVALPLLNLALPPARVVPLTGVLQVLASLADQAPGRASRISGHYYGCRPDWWW